MLRWYEIKALLTAYMPLSYDAAHIHLGLVLFLAVLFLVRRHRARFAIAWFVLLAATLFNEALDAYDWVVWTGTVNWHEAVKDLVNTMAWPTIFWAIAAVRERRRTSAPRQ